MDTMLWFTPTKLESSETGQHLNQQASSGRLQTWQVQSHCPLELSHLTHVGDCPNGNAFAELGLNAPNSFPLLRRLSGSSHWCRNRSTSSRLEGHKHGMPASGIELDRTQMPAQFCIRAMSWHAANRTVPMMLPRLSGPIFICMRLICRARHTSLPNSSRRRFSLSSGMHWAAFKSSVKLTRP